MEDSPFEERQNSEIGRYLVAKRRLPGGETIFTEAPIGVYSKYEKTVDSEIYFTCSTCYRVLERWEQKSCKHCSWPFCSRKCANDAGHREMECDVFRMNQVLPTSEATGYLHLIKLLIVKEKYPVKWDQLMNLGSQTELDDITKDLGFDSSIVCAESFLRKSCGMNVSQELIWKLKKMVKVNGFCLEEKSRHNRKGVFRQKKGPTECIAFYPVSCLLAHSCANNVDWRRCQSKEEKPFTISLFSRRDIEAGEIVSISYKGKFIQDGTHDRRRGLWNELGFDCQCPRCKDPTELDTYYSGVKCPECTDGWALPDIDSEDDEFICDECDCCLDEEEVAEIEAKFKSNLEGGTTVSANRRARYLDGLLDRASTGYYNIHPNHRLVIIANKAWFGALDMERLYRDGPEIDERFDKLISRAEQSLAVMDLFGTNEERIEMNSLIVTTLIRYYFKCNDYFTIRVDMADLEEKIKVLEKIVKHLFRNVTDADPLTRNEAEFARWTKMYDKWNSRLKKCEKKSLSRKPKVASLLSPAIGN